MQPDDIVEEVTLSSLQKSLHQLNEVKIQEKKPKRFKFLSSLKAKHENYVTVLWYISFGIGMFYGLLRLLAVIFNAIRAGDFFTFAFAILLNSAFTFFWGFFGGIVVFVVLFVLTFIPYLVVRGFAK